MKPEARRIWAASNLNESLGSRSSSSTAAEEGHRVQKVEAELEKFPTRPKISQQMEKKFRMTRKFFLPNLGLSVTKFVQNFALILQKKSPKV